MGTEKWFYIVIVCCIAHEIASEMRTYNGDKVLRISYQNNGEFENVMAAIYNSMLKHAVEIWSFSENDTDSFLDVHVEGNYFHKFSSVLRELNVEFHVFIDDVQRLIDDELDSMERTNENKKVRKTRQAEQVPDDVIGQFANVSETMAWLDQLVARYDIMEREVIGKTFEGRDIVLFKIGVEKPGVKKPAVWVDAATHAREWISPSSLNYLIFKLLQSCVDGTEDRKLVEELDWYLVPIVNPDGYQYTFDTQRLWRKNRAWSEEHNNCTGTDINRNYPYQWGYLGNPYAGDPCQDGYRGPEPGSENETQAIMSSILSHSDSIQVYVTLHSYERQAALEKEREKEIMSMEKRYQDQIRMLQSQLESERRSLLAQSTNQQQVLESQLERSQGEESRLKEHLTLAQKDTKRMESELAEMVERCQELEKRTLHQQQELNSAATLQVKLEELEAQRDSWLLTEQETSLQRLCQLQEENKHLKDTNDELATEVRELQSQRVKHRSPESANYKGSLVSEYTIHDTKNQPLHLKSDHQELKVIDNHHQQCDDQEFTSEAVNGDYDSLKEQHQAELHAIERGMSLERHDIEESFRLEISDLEEKLVEERKHLCQRFEKEKRELELEANKALTAALIGQEEELQSRFEEEKQDMLIKNESEKNHLHLQWEEETEKLRTRLQTEHQQELQRELTEQREEFDKQLEQTVTTDRSSYNSLQQAHVEAKLRQQKEELEALFGEERETLVTSFRLEQAAMEEQHQSKVASYENIFVKGTEGLHGQLQRDFWSLVDKHRSQVAEQERLRTKDEAAWEREDLIMRMQDERNLLLRQHEDEIRRLSQQHLQEMDDLRETMTQEVEESNLKMTTYQHEVAAAEDRGRREVDALHISFSRERSSWERQREIMKETAEDDAMSTIQAQLQDEFIDQIGKIKVSFDEERCELESTIRLLRRELEVASESQDNQVALETRHRQQLDDLQKVIVRLRDEKDEMQAKNKQLETRIDQLQQKYLESTAMSAMNKLPKFTNNLDKEAILQAIESQQKLMEDKTAELKTQIELLQKSSQLPDTTQLEYEDALKNNETLLASLQAAEEKLVSNDRSDQRRTREAQLEKQLEASTNKLTEAKVALAVNNSRLLRDIQTEREKNSLRVDSKEVDVYNSKLVEAERRIGDLEEALETKAEETTKLLIESHTKSKKCVQNLEREKDQVAWQLKDTHEQLKQQLEKAAKTGLLVKDLYVENANLIHSLQLTEQRQKEAEKRVNQAEDKFLALKEVLKKIYPVVVR